jgi:hypothetical protein
MIPAQSGNIKHLYSYLYDIKAKNIKGKRKKNNRAMSAIYGRPARAKPEGMPVGHS